MYQDKNVDDDNSECEEFRNDGTNNKYKRPAISLNQVLDQDNDIMVSKTFPHPNTRSIQSKFQQQRILLFRLAFHLRFLKFQVLDIDQYVIKHKRHPDGRAQAVLRIYGINKNKNTFLISVFNFLSYFYVRCPPEFDYENPENLERLRRQLDVKFNILGYSKILEKSCTRENQLWNN